jgi:hypothetical protein
MKTYDPKQVIAVWGTIMLQGFTDDGDAISVAYDEDHVTKKVGLDGEVARAMNGNRTGKITLRFMATSMTNDLLSAAAAADPITRTSVYPFTLKDLSGNTLVLTDKAWVLKSPGPAYGKEVGVREWVLDTAQMTVVNGGIK